MQKQKTQLSFFLKIVDFVYALNIQNDWYEFAVRCLKCRSKSIDSSSSLIYYFW